MAFEAARIINEASGETVSDRLVTRLGARVYYGWVMLAVASLGGFVSAGSSQMYVSSILFSITKETGWTNTAISGALLAGTIMGGVASPLAGAWVDRYGPRALMSVAAVVMAAGFALMGWSPRLAIFYVGYMLARGAAQGALGGAAQRAIPVDWFLHYRGRALGIATMSVPLGAAVLATAGSFAQQHGWSWRDTFIAMAALTAVLVLPSCLLLLRRGPEALGLVPDGGKVNERLTSGWRRSRQVEETYLWTLPLALRTSTLRLLIGAALLAIGANGTLVFYHVTYLMSRNISQVQAVTALSALALCGAMSNVAWGYLTEFFHERHLAILSQMLAAVGILLMLCVDTLGGALALSIVLGLLIRGEGSLNGLILSNYFGRFAFGRLSGLMGSFQLIGLGLGPVVASVVFDLFHSYASVYGLLSAMYATSAVLYMIARPPRPPG